MLTLMKAREGSERKYPGNFHIGFFMGDKEAVDDVHLRLKNDGFDVPAPEDTGHSYGFYVRAPGGLLIEAGA